MPLTARILDRPAPEGARAVVRLLLEQARARTARLADPDDAEALHDFRVSVRRLRSTLRAWRGELGDAVRDKDLRRLGRAARATGEARDAEVLRGWVERLHSDLPPAHRPAAAWLRERLHPRHGGRAVARAGRRLLRVADALDRRLLPGASGTDPFARALAAHVRKQVSAITGWLAAVQGPDDAPRAHRARIEVKRLRYLLDPLRGVRGVEVEPALESLRALQELLGELNDARLAARALREAGEEAGRGLDRERHRHWRGRPLRPGLRALERRADARAEELFERLRGEVLPTAGAAQLGPALALAAALAQRTATASGAGKSRTAAVSARRARHPDPQRLRAQRPARR